jgi:hypothetical protein
MRFGNFSFGGTYVLGINWRQLILVGESQRFSDLQCVLPVTDHLGRVAKLRPNWKERPECESLIGMQ